MKLNVSVLALQICQTHCWQPSVNLAADDVVRSAIGEHIADKFIEAKKIEYTSYRQFVSQWETDSYLENY
jgi:glutamine synthetase